MKNVVFSFIFCLLIINDCMPQPLSFDENSRAHRRYWYYRTRMINDFMKIGGEQGDCVTFAQRNHIVN